MYRAQGQGNTSGFHKQNRQRYQPNSFEAKRSPATIVRDQAPGLLLWPTSVQRQNQGAQSEVLDLLNWSDHSAVARVNVTPSALLVTLADFLF